MKAERWQQIDKLLERVLELEPGERRDFLDEACAGDEELFREVEALLGAYEQAGSLLSSPAFGIANQKSADSLRSLTGETLSHYQILSRLGEGGMGIVYKARDQHLDRFVAIKVLPPELVADPDRKRRFVQEAKAASALNHPNIITIHDIASDGGTDFIVMEYVEGKTLGQLIPRRGMKLNEVLKYAIQIADSLAKAHGAGIVHRDLKPGNIMVGDGGLVKVLDFGLAKLIERPQVREDEATRTTPPWTDEGTILGTAAYMSPEQAAGKPVDTRADIFSFGSVLYEMATGQRAFQGDSKMSILVAVLNQDPKSVREISRAVPHELENIIHRCLRKDPERRFQHMADMKVFLQDVLEKAGSGEQAEGVELGQRRTRPALMVGGLFACLAVLALAIWLWRSPRNSAEPPVVAVPLTTYPGHERFPALSPDGNQVAFSWNGEQQDNFDIYVKLIGAEDDPLQLTKDSAEDSSPAWSPDGRWIAFLRDLGGGKAAVLRVPPIGGSERKLGEIQMPLYSFGHPLTWSPDGDSLVIADRDSDSGPFGLFVLSVESGEKRRLTLAPVLTRGDSAPVFSPDGHTIAFVRTVDFGSADLYLLDVREGLRAAGEPSRLTTGRWQVADAAWHPERQEILFSDGITGGLAGFGNLWRVAATRSEEPRRLAITEIGFGVSVSRQKHRLIYSREVADINIWRVAIAGTLAQAPKPDRFISSTRGETDPQISPDGKRVVFSSNRSGNAEIWICDSDRSNSLPLTYFGKGQAGSGRWSPDSAWVTFDSNFDGQYEVYVVSADGGKPRRMTSHPAADATPSWSRDGKWIYFGSTRSGIYQVWKMPASGGEAVQITQKGGFVPLESHDGTFVYYMKGYYDRRIWKVASQGGEEVEVLRSPILARNFDVAKDGIYFVPGPQLNRIDSIRFLSFATGEIKTIASIENAWSNYISVSSDGRWILYTKLDSEGSDLMLVENFH